jgi:hypothetical protein
MRNVLSASLVAFSLAVSADVIAAQDSKSSKDAPKNIELTGCVSLAPEASGQFALVDAASGGTYRLSGKGIGKYAGQRVTVVGGPQNRRLGMRFGLWPSPNVAAQAGALDPAQESIARQQGGSASGTETRLPEFRVVRMRGVEGSCQ